MHDTTIILQLLILTGTATAVATVFHYFRLPTIVGFIVSGGIIGPYGLGVVNTVPGAEFLSEMGVIFLMFTIGLEISVSQLKDLKRPFLGLGLTQIVGTVAITAVILHFSIETSWYKSLFFGYLLSLSSTAIVVKMLQDARETASPYGVGAIGILLCQDLAVIAMMLSVPLLTEFKAVENGFSFDVVGLWGAKFLVLGVFLWIVGRYLLPFILARIVKTKSRELFFFTLLLLCFGVGYLMQQSGLSLSLGAFIAGLMIAESPYGRQATSDIVPMRDNFLGLFFASVGMLVDPKFILFKAHWIFLIVFGILIIKPGIVYIMGRILKYQASTAIIAGLMVFQVGEFSFVLANTGKTMGLIDQDELQMFLSVSVITMMITPFIFRLAPRFAFSSSFVRFSGFDFAEVPKGVLKVISDATRNSPAPQKSIHSGEATSAHTIIIGFGVAGQNLAAGFRSLNIPYKIIEQNIDLVAQFKNKGEPIQFGDASRVDILDYAGIDTAKLVVIAASGVHMTEAIVDTIRKLRPDVQIIIRTQYSREAEPYRALEHCTLVIAEFETTIELLACALQSYGVSGQDIQGLMAQTRKRLRGSTVGWSDYLRKNVDMPVWDTISSIKPLLIKSGYPTVGRSISELSLRPLTGTTIVAVFREGLGTIVPTGQYVIEEGDVLHLIGDEESFLKAKNLLSGNDEPSALSRL